MPRRTRRKARDEKTERGDETLHDDAEDEDDAEEKLHDEKNASTEIDKAFGGALFIPIGPLSMLLAKHPATIMEWVKKGAFPPPVQLGASNQKIWRKSDILKYFDNLKPRPPYGPLVTRKGDKNPKRRVDPNGLGNLIELVGNAGRDELVGDARGKSRRKRRPRSA